MLGGLLAPVGSAAASDAERPEAVSTTPADEAGKGKAFWEDDRLPEASAEQKASRAAAEEG
ncbi:hypothetical protein G3M53_73580, partial [Streptomyces sp. SID7982]|nr:hypothetical protein [Streptomyces sp. SID7982]